MFLHSFKYAFKQTIRQKEYIIWLILFPIILGSLFKIAFANLYDDHTFSAISVAIVEDEKNEIFSQVLNQVSEGDEPLLKPEYTDNDKARQMLKDEDVKGIIYTSDISLTVSDNSIDATILKSFLEQYKVQEKIITDTVKTDPAKLQTVISKLSEDINCNENIKLTDDKMDNSKQYFYNLFAMVSLFGSMSGLYIALESQGNLSEIGARKCISPVNKLTEITASLLSHCAAQSVCSVISVTFIRFVLKIDFGSRLPLVYIACIIGGILGVTMGFLIGSLGQMKSAIKMSIAMTVSMMSCFFSGLMIGNMKAVVAEYAPWFNKINPAAVISDCFYCLDIYSDYSRFTEKIITMLIMIVIFTAGGYFMTRRRRYASL